MFIEYQVEDTSFAEGGGTSRGAGNEAGDKDRSHSEHGLTCISWNDCPFEPAKLAVGGYSKVARVYTLEGNTLQQECVLGEHTNVVHDIAWAPAMGRSYHLIATASRESTFKIHRLSRKENGSLEYVSSKSVESTTKSNVWRVAWNATGTVLATSAEDGTLSLWRRDFAGEWINVQDLPSGGQQQMTFLYQNP
ncbi:WD40-repeat-containing domain protein [Ochromonadaceae sp. CCMP2298]|nr:WD40-repeat-containing domain protein [Ochromonadaceae sp. CCMP2298]